MKLEDSSINLAFSVENRTLYNGHREDESNEEKYVSLPILVHIKEAIEYVLDDQVVFTLRGGI